MSPLYHSSIPTTSKISRKPLPPSYTRIAQDASQTTRLRTKVQQEEFNVPSSEWAIGWKTPTSMIAYYILALLFSIIHLSMFIYLDNRPITSYHQSYVTTASTILASAFGLSLNAALGIAFTQKLWNILRKSFHKLRTVENLFTMRNNLYKSLRWTVMRSAPFLSLFTMVLWGLRVATTFPPGALTVVSRPYETTFSTQVMVLNTSFVGSGSLADATSNSLAEIWAGNLNIGITKSASRGAVFRSAVHAMIARSITTSPSPCGLNCTYNLQFLGLYLLCDTPNTKNATVPGRPIIPSPIYLGVWLNPNGVGPTSPSVTSFNTSIIRNWGFLKGGEFLLAQITSMVCKPYQATYHVIVNYQNGVQSFNVTKDSIQPLPDSAQNISFNCLDKRTCCNAYDGVCNYQPAINWTDPSIHKWLISANNMAIIESMSLALSGQYNMVYGAGNDSLNYTFPNGTISQFDQIYPVDAIGQGLVGGQRMVGPINGTIIANTALNQNIDQFNNISGPEFFMTQDLLNEMLQNVNLSLMNTFGIWKTEVNATQSTYQNFYSFNKLTLPLPYYISLIISIPLLAIGILALRENGVSATDGGFLQILTTTSTSRSLHRVAENASLGGEENVLVELEELKVMFGEVNLGWGKRRVGFGVEGEVVPIKKGARYDGDSRTIKTILADERSR